MPVSRADKSHDLNSRRGFTLVELCVVMILLGIAAAFVAPHMSTFFRGRVLNSEGRRLLALTHYGQTRAIAEGVPVLLWVNTQKSSYGLMTQSAAADPDDRASSFTADATLTLETVGPNPAPTSEAGDELLGVPSGLAVIRFLPDGYYDPSSLAKIVIRQGTEGALELVPTPNLLGYEILPYSKN